MMRTIALLVAAALASLARTQTTYPACAQSCISPAISAIGCTDDSVTCQCSPSDLTAFDKAVTPCVEAACSTEDQYLAIAANAEICALYSFSLITASLSTAFTFSYSTPTVGIGGFLTTATVTRAGSRTTTTKTTVGVGVATATSGGSTSQSGELMSSGSDGGLSAGAKAGIGIGATVGGLLFIGLIVLAFVYGRRSARQKSKVTLSPPSPPARVDPFGKVELGGDSKPVFVAAAAELKPLNDEEKAELENRRRAKDLENGVMRESVTVSPVALEAHEVGGAERYELDALRREAGVRYELG